MRLVIWGYGCTTFVAIFCKRSTSVRAKFFQQYRLFFRYHAQAKVIVFAWVNDEDTKQAYGSGR